MPLAKDTDIPIEYLRECFSLDPTVPSGLRWRERPLARFDGDERIWKAWNAKLAGKAAGSLSKEHGYWVIMLKSARASPIRAHRIVVALTKGEWPPDEVDHKNRARAVNKPGNLREATRSQNSQNRDAQPDNLLGVKGVSWDKRRGKWRARIGVDDREIGERFDSFMDACQARWAAEIAHHPFRAREPEPSKPKPFDRVPDGAFVTGCWSIGDNPNWTVLDYA